MRSQILAGRDLADAERVLPAPHRVFQERDLVLFRAHRPGADLVERLALGLPVRVYEDLLDARAHASARVDRILLPGLEARVVEVVLVLVGDAGVVLLQATDELLLQLCHEPPIRSAHRLVVGVLSPEVPENVWPRARVVAEPVIGVDAASVRRCHLVGPSLGQRRRRLGRRGREPGSQHEKHGGDSGNERACHGRSPGAGRGGRPRLSDPPRSDPVG